MIPFIFAGQALPSLYPHPPPATQTVNLGTSDSFCLATANKPCLLNMKIYYDCVYTKTLWQISVYALNCIQFQYKT